MHAFRRSVLVLLVALVAPAYSAQHQSASPRAKVASPHGTLDLACENCHTYTSWTPLRAVPEFDHDKTRYPLHGMHVNVGCRQCHTSLVFSKVSTRCADCHADFHRRQFGTNCDTCHTVKGWKVDIQAIKNHQNRFPLVGAHAAAQCEDCHVNAASGQFIGLSTDCYSCHSKQFATPVFDHRGSGFPVTCESCHTMNSWLGAKFDHLKFTGFALNGIHATLDCTACHLNSKFAGTPATCYGCHAKDYSSTNSPNHANAGFPQDCALCHSTATWLGASFDHSKTKFPLTGAHTSVLCASCHVGNNYTTLPTNCVGCHLQQYKSVTNPDHVALGWPTDCTICHTTANWTNANFNHTTYTKYPLTGMHATVPCLSCHVGGKYAGTPADCASCHLKDYNATTNPNHKAAGLPTDCSLCHATVGWSPASFDHSKTNFPLTGAHKTLSCVSCHKNGQYQAMPTSCVSCHLNDFNGTTNPNHVKSGFPNTCDVCHSTTAWIPASFDHSKTGFPLTGQHLNITCDTCHKGNYSGGLPTDCYSCHKTDYASTTNPNHTAAMFPTTCSTCHTTVTWLGAVFKHTWFPIYSGNHAGVWTSCGDCHTNPANFATFSCINCHHHSRANTDSEHSGVRGYSYGPTTCYNCHPTGSGGG